MRAAFLPLILLLLSAMPGVAAEGPFKRIRTQIAAIVDPSVPTSAAGAIFQGTLSYCVRHGKLPDSREHLVEGLECAELPLSGLDGIHQYKKGRVEAPLRVNLEVTVDKQGLKFIAKQSVMPPGKKEGAKP